MRTATVVPVVSKSTSSAPARCLHSQASPPCYIDCERVRRSGGKTQQRRPDRTMALRTIGPGLMQPGIRCSLKNTGKRVISCLTRVPRSSPVPSKMGNLRATACTRLTWPSFPDFSTCFFGADISQCSKKSSNDTANFVSARCLTSSEC